MSPGDANPLSVAGAPGPVLVRARTRVGIRMRSKVVPRGQLAAQEGEMYGRGYRGRVGAEGSGELTAQLLVCGERLGLASVDGQARIMRAVSRSSAGRCRTASRK